MIEINDNLKLLDERNERTANKIITLMEKIKKSIYSLFNIKKNSFWISNSRMKELKKELEEKKENSKIKTAMVPIFFKRDRLDGWDIDYLRTHFSVE